MLAEEPPSLSDCRCLPLPAASASTHAAFPSQNMLLARVTAAMRLAAAPCSSPACGEASAPVAERRCWQAPQASWVLKQQGTQLWVGIWGQELTQAWLPATLGWCLAEHYSDIVTSRHLLCL